MSVKAKKIHIRMSADFVFTQEEFSKLPGKYLIATDREGKHLADGELYLVCYEDEEGKECDEDGEYLNQEE